MADSTPMMQQYQQIKSRHRDAILFFRLGDFYEMFHADAQEASRILSLTLTQRNGVPMCGIPYHAAQGYIGRLLKAGKKIAVCEQVQLPEGGKGIAEREVVEVLTPGTVTDESMLEGSRNNFLVALGARQGRGGLRKEIGFLALDISTGELLATAIRDQDPIPAVRRELYRFSPKELILQESFLDDFPDFAGQLRDDKNLTLNRYPDWFFDSGSGHRRLCEILGVSSLRSFGLEENAVELYAAGALLEYVQDTVRHSLGHLQGIRVFTEDEGLGIDESSQKNLELVANMHDGTRNFSLLEVVDRTRTAMGARLLHRRILSPLRDISELRARHAQLRKLYRHQDLLGRIVRRLSDIRDLDRLSARVSLDKAHAKDMLALGSSLDLALELVGELDGPEFADALADLDLGSIRDCALRITQTIEENPPVVLHEGNLIRAGVNEEVDRLRRLRDESKALLEEHLEREREKTGISTLRVKYNKIIGYHYEVSKGQLGKVPEHFIRRQSLVNAERFSTEELGEVEEELNSAGDRLVDAERQLFLELRDFVKGMVPAVLAVGRLVAAVDVAASLAQSATEYGWVEPILSQEPLLRIVRGRHPVVEAHSPRGAFVPNGVDLRSGDAEAPRTALITGPNMAGKSTYLRQNALIVLLAQIGSYVPAEEAEIGICDRVFCRVGASDNLARGESTFLVEMNETALILRTATDRSLVIMDEVGRGTSTQDGLAIAQAVLEHLVQDIGCRTLFATHYHELTGLKLEGMANFTLKVQDNAGSVVFLKEVVPGASSSSYGIHVAQIAGIPSAVLDRAHGLLVEQAERSSKAPEAGTADPGGEQASTGKLPAAPRRQLGLFSPAEQVAQELRNLDPETISPLQALVVLARLKEQLK